MKGKFFRQLFMAAAVPPALLSVSCVREHLPEGSGVTAGIEILVDGDFRDTRSAVGPESSLDGYESEAKDMTVFQFGKSSGGGYVLERSYHFNLTGGAAPKVSGVFGRGYRFYAVLNCGDLSSCLSRGDGESKLTGIALSCPPSEFSLAKGMPMACGPVDAALGTTLALRFTRLPARYDFRVAKIFSHGTFRIKSLRLRQSPTETSPFAPKRAFSVSEASKMADGDRATDSDITALEAGSSVRFYTLENACGRSEAEGAAERHVSGRIPADVH